MSVAHFDETKKFFQRPPRPLQESEINQLYNQIDFLNRQGDQFFPLLAEQFSTCPTSSLAFDNFNMAFKEKYYQIDELNAMALILEAFLKVYKSFLTMPGFEHFIFEPKSIGSVRTAFLNHVRSYIDQDGTLNYAKNPELSKLFKELHLVETHLRQEIAHIARHTDWENVVQFKEHDVVNDRFVLAVKSDSYRSNLGPIVAKSNSGMTLFVEPPALRERSNHRLKLLAEIESIIHRLSLISSQGLHQNAHTAFAMANFMLELDRIHARTRFSVDRNFVRPSLAKSPSFELIGVYHPLVEHAVANDLAIKSSQKGFIISGPNTGGKTVSLKCVALSHLFLHLGLFIPAKSAELYPYRSLFFFSHDHQSLKDGLSSFASEAKGYLEMLGQLESSNLFVIDEIFNSTSSEEASALAISFLDEVHSRSQAHLVISTHHQMLKTFMHSNKEYISAHVGYDFESNRPTYKLIIGEPGSSLALKIFETLSEKVALKTQIVSRATSLLEKKQITYESLLQELSQKKGELDKLLIQNQEISTQLKNQKSAMQGTLFLEKQRIMHDYNKKLSAILNKGEQLIDDIRADKIQSKKQFHQSLGKLEDEGKDLHPIEVAYEDKYSHLPAIRIEDVTVGMPLLSITLGKQVKVLAVNLRKNEVQIQSGPMTIWAPIETLRSQKQISKPIQKIHVHIEKQNFEQVHWDCRGMRLEEFQTLCEKIVTALIAGEIPFATIVHGHGSGVLKNWLRKYLAQFQQDLKWDNEEGNDGCTRITLLNSN